MKILNQSQLSQISGGNNQEISENCFYHFNNFCTALTLDHKPTSISFIAKFVENCSVQEMDALEFKLKKASHLAEKINAF